MIQLIMDGKWFMAPLLLCSIAGLAAILDRFLYLRRAVREADAVLPVIEELTERGDIDAIHAYCEENAGTLTRIFGQAVRKFRQIEDLPSLDFIQAEINKIMEDASLLNTVDLERRLPVLNTIGNVAPLFGFAGTVTGMISAFEVMTREPNITAAVVAGGFKEALVTTASGLVIAIPCVLFYNYFMHQIEALNARVEETANGLLDSLVMRVVRGDEAAPVGGE